MAQIYEYFRKPKTGTTTAVAEPPQAQILNDEDEKFLERLTSEEAAPPLPERPVVILDNGSKVTGKDAQIALMDGAEKMPLPGSPPVEDLKQTSHGKDKAKEKGQDYLSYVKGIPAMIQSKTTGKGKAGSDLQAAVDAAKAGKTVSAAPVTDEAEVEREKDDLTSVLDQLNLSAVNNRAFSFSEKSQKMMAEFTQILKDIVNGVPTAYNDLEQFLKHWDEHLHKMFGDLPPFLQNLVKTLPAKMSGSVAPGLLAAMSDKPGADAQAAGIDTRTSSQKMRQRIPSLKKLVGSQAAVTKMLQSILNFLKLRFPAVVTGTNVLMSLAVFLLLFVFWYCHKRGRETRLERERLAAEGAAAGDDSDFEKTSSELEDSAVLEKDAKMQRILNQSQPASVPLPAASPSEQRK